jgi:hypothetical protein
LNLCGGVEAVQQRHDEVEHDHVRLEAFSQLDGFAAVGGLADHVEPFALEQDAKALSENLMVVGKKHSDWHG